MALSQIKFLIYKIILYFDGNKIRFHYYLLTAVELIWISKNRMLNNGNFDNNFTSITGFQLHQCAYDRIHSQLKSKEEKSN